MNIRFKTDLFFRDIPDNQIDQWFVGGDCAGWIFARLLPDEEISHDLDPVMEDWGWYMAVKVRDVVVEFTVGEDPETYEFWQLGISSKQKFFRKHSVDELAYAKSKVVEAVLQILKNDDRFTDISCSESD